MDTSKLPTRRKLLKTGTAAAVGLGVAPFARANTAPQLMRHASREIVLQFNVAPGLAKGVLPSKLKHS